MVSFTDNNCELQNLVYFISDIIESNLHVGPVVSLATTSHNQTTKKNTKISPTQSLQLASFVNDPLS